MKTWKYIGVGFTGLWLAAQLFSPSSISKDQSWQSDFFKAYPAPPVTQLAFVKHCSACHGGKTTCKWFASAMPFQYFAKRTLSKSQAALDFSNFLSLPKEQRMELLDQCAQLIRESSIEKHIHSYWISTTSIDKNTSHSIHHWISSFSEYEESLEADAMVEE